MNERKDTVLYARIYADTDPELYAWLSVINADNTRQHGEKALKIKQVFRAGLQALGLSGQEETLFSQHTPLDTEGLVAQLTQVLPSAIAAEVQAQLLAQLRKVVDAAVASAIPQAIGNLGSMPLLGHAPADDDEDSALFAALDANLILEDDDDDP